MLIIFHTFYTPLLAKPGKAPKILCQYFIPVVCRPGWWFAWSPGCEPYQENTVQPDYEGISCINCEGTFQSNPERTHCGMDSVKKSCTVHSESLQKIVKNFLISFHNTFFQVAMQDIM